MNDTEKFSKACCSGSCRLKFQSMVKAFNGLLIDFACIRRSLGLHFNLHLILFSLPKQSLTSSLSFPWLISHQRSWPDPVTLSRVPWLNADDLLFSLTRVLVVFKFQVALAAE